jgi:Na+/proline symporter
MLLSIFTVYATSNLVGSPGKMYDLLWDAAKLHPVDGNAEGSYLTMRSVQGGYVGLIFVGSGFSAAVDSQLYSPWPSEMLRTYTENHTGSKKQLQPTPQAPWEDTF